MMKVKTILNTIIFTVLSSTAMVEAAYADYIDPIEIKIKEIEAESKSLSATQVIKQTDYSESKFNAKNIKLPNVKDGKFTTYGMASFYGKQFHGRKTASGEVYNMYAMTAAHNRLKFGTKVRVTCTATGRSVVVKINDTGAFGKKYGRSIDLSYGAAKAIGMIERGVAKVKIEVL